MRAILAVLAAASGVLLIGACGSPPPPTSTTPATPGSAVILPSPVTAETVPRSDAPSAVPSASASHS